MRVAVYFTYDYRTQPPPAASGIHGPFHELLPRPRGFPAPPQTWEGSFTSVETEQLMREYAADIKPHLQPPPRIWKWLKVEEVSNLWQRAQKGIYGTNMMEWFNRLAAGLARDEMAAAVEARWFVDGQFPPTATMTELQWEDWVEGRVLELMSEYFEDVLESWDVIGKALSEVEQHPNLFSDAATTIIGSLLARFEDMQDDHSHIPNDLAPLPPYVPLIWGPRTTAEESISLLPMPSSLPPSSFAMEPSASARTTSMCHSSLTTPPPGFYSVKRVALDGTRTVETRPLVDPLTVFTSPSEALPSTPTSPRIAHPLPDRPTITIHPSLPAAPTVPPKPAELTVGFAMRQTQ